MIVFNHSISFPDQASLNSENANTGLEEITVVRQQETKLRRDHAAVSEWTLMSGQQARFTSETAFLAGGPNPHWSLEIKGVLVLTWEATTRQIHYQPGELFTPERLLFWTLHTMLPLVLALDGRMDFLHAGSVEIDGRPVMFTAESFGGKSTLTAHFIKQGHGFLADDSLGILCQAKRFHAVASYPFHRPFRDPEKLGYPVRRMMHEPRPLHAIYRLERVEPDAPVAIKGLAGVDSFKALHFASFVRFEFLKQHRFQLASDLASAIPTYSVQIPWDINRLGEVYEELVLHLQGSTAQT